MGQVFRSSTQAATPRGAWSGTGAWQEIGLRGRSEPDDDQGGVVGGAAGWQQFEQNGVDKGFGVDSLVADEGVPVDVRRDDGGVLGAVDRTGLQVDDFQSPGGPSATRDAAPSALRSGPVPASSGWVISATMPGSPWNTAA
ncbi:hypothetical protein [Streptomyces sp. NPDC057460]|uniref:hypothetical protein n=1 Tax=Streptomyces sp. NPDC057460 TaxID=3346141 RepID=UPI0036BC02D3